MGSLSPTTVTFADSDTEVLGTLPTRELRKFILNHGGEDFGILERSELVERAMMIQQKRPPPEEPVLLSALGSRCEETVGADAQMADFLSATEIAAVHDLASKVGDSGRSPNHATHRSGAWDTLYLQTGGAFSTHLPSLAGRLLAAAREVDEAQGWHLLGSAGRRVTMRVVEYHTVRTHGSLPWAHHFDEGSLLTIDCMLSCPAVDFAGGVFQTLETDGELQPHPFERGDVQIFRSHKYHCVTPVSAGERNVLVIELWDGDERRCAHRCEQRKGRCPLE
jgi:hypothetical protein